MKWLLIGNMSNQEERREVLKETGEQYAQSQGIPFLETSDHSIDKVRGHLVIGASLSEPHSSGTALQRGICMSVGLLEAIFRKF